VSYFEAALLPEASKRAMCEELLSEFGASVRRINDKSGEMIHGCLVSPDLHSDQDRNPTASLNYLKLTYNCLGCGASGGLLWFIATCRDESSLDARRWLEKTAGLGGQVLELAAMLRFLDAIAARPANLPIPSYSEKLLAAWDFKHPYFLEERHITEEVLSKYRLGWDPRTDRVVLPHFWERKLVGWQTRKLPDEWRAMPLEDDSPDMHSGMPNSPKYHSSPDFPKESTIYNHLPSMRAVVTEAMLSVLRHEHAYHAEAVFGAKVTDLQMRRLVKHDEVVLWMDNDRAGWDAVLGHPEVPPTKEKPQGKEAVPGMAEVLSAYTRVRVVDSSWSQDPADLPTDEAVNLVDAAVPWSVWQPPQVLYCFECKHRAHSGPCNS
jgi:hypothetical protein